MCSSDLYSNIPGLLLAGPLAANFGYATMATSLSAFGIIAIVLVGMYWRTAIWQREAVANSR